MGEGEFLRVELISADFTAEEISKIVYQKGAALKLYQPTLTGDITWLQFCQKSTSAPAEPHT